MTLTQKLCNTTNVCVACRACCKFIVTKKKDSNRNCDERNQQHGKQSSKLQLVCETSHSLQCLVCVQIILIKNGI